ncbi:eukaryotic translation initiation factor 3 [Amniculicola lignicola CBS 123094]|uniref:Eukaryotic translation initiation factor 3 subunit B n=1 Tax=Amniculicola lignicola CBS 123094 TaxID=1392246 RepID=A0A6A5W7J7_9PLEO|nr:eukaryotic translation initiation factor 3 [Amniculicola lignicola CBS 123094]
MAPSYENLPMEEDDFDESQIDFTDLEEQFQERLDESLDAFVVIDGLPKVPEENRPKLSKFVLRKLNSVGKVKEDGLFMPLSDEGQTEGYAFVEYNSPAEALAAVKQLHGSPLDKRHTMQVNKLTDIDRYGREGRIKEEYTAPEIPPFEQKEHLRSWLGDSEARDQMVWYRGEKVGVFWNEREEPPESVVDRENWTESFVQWSPQGTYLISMHAQGVQLWGGKAWSRQKRFAHPGVNLVDFSPSEKYFTTWSHRALQVDENHPVPGMSIEEDGKNYVIWDLATGKPLRSFATIDVPSTIDAEGQPVKKKMQWPTFKWSSDDKYVARMTQGQSISVYELPRMNLLDKTSIKIEGVMDFEWAPATPKRDGIKTYEQLFCYWTPELGSNPAKVGLMTIPSKEIVRTRNLFNVSDAKLHWQSEAAYVCVKVDRHSKSKKSLATNLEIFRVREKGVPVEVVDSIKDTVINFAWEPKGNRFVLITAGEIPAQGAAVPPKTSVSFFCPEKTKGGAPGNFRHVRTVDKKNSNAIYWSPKGRFVVVATLQSQQSFDLDFWDLSFDKPKDEKEESEKDLTANLQLMSTAEHYGVTDIEWDPTGRYVTTVASAFRHHMENGYHLYDFKGTLLREEHIDRFKQLIWRPRPPTLLSKEEQTEIRKNLRNYSKVFDEQDLAKKNTANRQVVEARREMLREWLEWRESMIEMLQEEGAEIELNGGKILSNEDADGRVEEIEEIVEEVIEETEEVIG